MAGQKGWANKILWHNRLTVGDRAALNDSHRVGTVMYDFGDAVNLEYDAPHNGHNGMIPDKRIQYVWKKELYPARRDQEYWNAVRMRESGVPTVQSEWDNSDPYGYISANVGERFQK